MKQITVWDVLQDEEKALLDRLAYIRRLKARIGRGELAVIDAGADVAGDATAWAKTQATVVK